MTARDSEIDELKGLSIGADDYITKPFSLKVLNIKVKKMLKIDENSSYKFNDLSFDFRSGELIVNGESIELTRREIQFLEYLIKNKGIIFSRDVLLNEVWGFDFEGDDRVVTLKPIGGRESLLCISSLLPLILCMLFFLNIAMSIPSLSLRSSTYSLKISSSFKRDLEILTASIIFSFFLYT